MASGTADLQRDLGGAIMQSIFGALLTAGYAAAAGAAIASSPEAEQGQRERPGRADQVLLQRRRGRRPVPGHAEQIIAAAKASFLQGDELAYAAGIVAIVLGGILVFFGFPKKEREQALLAEFAAEDA